MKKIEYTYADPTSNITLLVESEANKGDYKQIADSLMKQEPLAEQVGFVSIPKVKNEYDIELNMAGGEFCGNATMSAAALFYSKTKKAENNNGDRPKDSTFVKVKASGAKNIISVKIRNADNNEYQAGENTCEKTRDNAGEKADDNASVKTQRRTEKRIEGETCYLCELEMPGVKAIRDAKNVLHTDGTIVELEGITHLIVTNTENISGEKNNDNKNETTVKADTYSERRRLCISDKSFAEQKIKEYCSILNVECMGIMFVDEGQMTINALVYVPGADTLFWENSCASGTVACGAWYFDRRANRSAGSNSKELNGENALHVRGEKPIPEKTVIKEEAESIEKEEISFTHPGGKLSIRKTSDGRYFLGGKVTIYAGRELV